jgi:hypothetical protein
MTQACRDGGGNLHSEQVLATMGYDGAGQRISAGALFLAEGVYQLNRIIFWRLNTRGHWFALFLCGVVTACSSGEPRSGKSADAKFYSLDEFMLTSELTEEAVRAKVGNPDNIAGSGIPWLVYRLKTGEALLLSFDPYDAQKRLRAADLVSPNGKERKRLFGDELW